MFKDELKEYVETSGLVNMKEAGEGIYVLKYKKKVFYDGLWNPFIAECRGSIVDADFNLVTYPFTKIYNSHRKGSTSACSRNQSYSIS